MQKGSCKIFVYHQSKNLIKMHCKHIYTCICIFKKQQNFSPVMFYFIDLKVVNEPYKNNAT